MNIICQKCHKPVCRDVREVTFAAGKSPLRTFSCKVEASWCPTSGCYEEIRMLTRGARLNLTNIAKEEVHR